jgi:hypothetical protein
LEFQQIVLASKIENVKSFLCSLYYKIAQSSQLLSRELLPLENLSGDFISEALDHSLVDVTEKENFANFLPPHLISAHTSPKAAAAAARSPWVWAAETWVLILALPSATTGKKKPIT